MLIHATSKMTENQLNQKQGVINDNILYKLIQLEEVQGANRQIERWI